MSRGTAAVAIVFALLFARDAAAELTAGHLRCEYRVDPLGIDAARPRLSWVVDLRRRARAPDGLRDSGGQQPGQR